VGSRGEMVMIGSSWVGRDAARLGLVTRGLVQSVCEFN
jgi:hypothetical protein